ncbi:hypothetical protein FRB93_013528 [Tulasnella sp. JGI-2019a]|nr:hypothetical protein FRB93_013528 [Tulasnella sp. JGI-2019a]
MKPSSGNMNPKIAPAVNGSSNAVRPTISVQPRKILPLGNPPVHQAMMASSSTSSSVMSNGRQVLRVNRACNSCRKQKMRCEGPDNPPCARCRAQGQSCVFEKIQKQDSSDLNSQRISDLESKWSTIEGTLGDVLQELRDVKNRLGISTDGPNHQHVASTDSPMGSSSQGIPSTPFSPPAAFAPSPVSQSGGGPFSGHAPSGSFSDSRSPIPPHPPLQNQQNSGRLETEAMYPPFPPPKTIAASTARSLRTQSSQNFERAMSFNSNITSPNARRRGLSSNIYSAENSGGEEDLPNAALAAPISVVNGIAAAQPQTSDEEGGSSIYSEDDTRRRGSTSPSRPGTHPEKRKRRGSSSTDRSRTRLKPAEKDVRYVDGTDRLPRGAVAKFAEGESSVASPGSSLTRPRRRKPQDVVAKGLISEGHAQQLYRNYFSGCHRLLAVFDPSIDTYASIKERSPFLLCALLMVGAKVQDGPTVSDIQSMLLHEATEHAKDRVFESKGHVEDVQALLLLAGWSHSMGGVGWLTAGHAIRLAVELGLHKALSRLHRLMQTDMKTDTETHRPLITGARTWLALYVFEYQISFGTGRPAMMQGDAAITEAKTILLGHPLSIATDARLVSTCDLLTRQSAIHERLQKSQVQSDDKLIFQTLQEATADIDAWLSEWDAHMSMSQPTAGFFRSSAAIQRAYAHLFHNCIALRGLKTVEDAKALSPEMSAIALQAIQSAKECVTICLSNQEYRHGLRYAVAYTHTCAAFAGAFLLRFARLFRKDLDLAETTSLVDALADVLSEVPAVSLGVWLRKLLNHTRDKAATFQEPNPIPNISPYGYSEDQRQKHNSSTPVVAGSAVPFPSPPAQLPNSHPFMPVGASGASNTTTPPQFVNTDVYPQHGSVGMPNHTSMAMDQSHGGVGAAQGGMMDVSSYHGGGDAGMGNPHGFLGDLGDGNDWPPWLTTSMVGDLDYSGQTPGPTNMPFAWNPQMQ